MKRNLLAITATGALALGTIGAYAEEHGGCGHGGRGMHRMMMGNPVEHLTKELDLTPEQQATVGPIIDQAKPQLEAIHREAMEKTRGVMENCAAQIRPLLSSQQQTKFDAIKNAHEEMLSSMKKLREAKQQ
ncbi:MAG: Spy/CpxP family protein refolding chaperone [Verrucomicrobiota bacterium]|nr:Spy/CpxP family protein refolding chaperone [Verrucomicrobiota bacterium]